MLFFFTSILGANQDSTDYRNHIYFSSTNIGDLKLSVTARCAIKTACHFNPNSKITLITRNNVEYSSNDPIFSECPTFSIKKMNLGEDLFKGTSLLSWYNKAIGINSKYFNADLSDAIRTALMWKYGGVYFDLDMISLKSLIQICFMSTAAEA